jgi:hypothetical protein
VAGSPPDIAGHTLAPLGRVFGQTVTIGRYLTPENIRLGLSGLAAGFVVGLVWRVVIRVRWGGLPVVLAVLIAAHHTGRTDRFRWDSAATVSTFVLLLAGLGMAQLVARFAIGSVWAAVGSLVSAGGVYVGVPETGPAVVVAGALSGLAAALAVTGSRWAPTAGLGMAAVLGWAAMSGAVGRPWAVVGGALCTGVAPWFGLRTLLPTPRRQWRPGPWLLGAHVTLVILAARWIGVAPDAGWLRVAAVAAAGLAIAMATQRPE